MIAVAPGFMLGALGFLVSEDLGFSEVTFGVVVASFFGAFALAANPSGRLADSIGPYRSLQFGLGVSALGMVGVATLASSQATIMLWMVVSGAGGALTMIAAGLALVRGITARRGLMFSVSQSASPMASLVGGLTVPTIALGYGWRWAFVIPVLLVPIAAATLYSVGSSTVLESPKRTVDENATRRDLLPRSIYILALVAGLGGAAASALGAFLVETGIDYGLSPSLAGIVLAAGSLIGIVSRLFVGWKSDSMTPGQVVPVGLMLAGGAVGYVGIAQGLNSTPVFLIGVLIAYVFGYAWPGLLFFGVTQLYPAAPASALGVVIAGGSVGATAGPAIFGAIVAAAGFEAAWIGSAVMAATAFLLLVAGRRRLMRRTEEVTST